MLTQAIRANPDTEARIQQAGVFAGLAMDPAKSPLERGDFLVRNLVGADQSHQAAVAFEQASKRTLDITLKQQELGAVSYLALLSARQAYQQALITRVQSQASRFADTAALFQALGGGWWNR